MIEEAVQLMIAAAVGVNTLIVPYLPEVLMMKLYEQLINTMNMIDF
jgi:hypothetical protein